MKQAYVLSLLLGSVSAGIGQHCTPDPEGLIPSEICICYDRDRCNNWPHGRPLVRTQWSDGSYPCPHDPANIIGCVVELCDGPGTYCSDLGYCQRNGDVLTGKLP